MSWHIYSFSSMILLPDNKRRGKCKKVKWKALQFSLTKKIPTIWANSSVLELNILSKGSTSSCPLSLVVQPVFSPHHCPLSNPHFVSCPPRRCHGRQHQSLYSSWGKQPPLLSPHPSSQSPHHGRLLGWSSMISPLQIHLQIHSDRWIPITFLSSCVWKSFPGGCSQGLRWVWLACTFLDLHFCPPWRYEWYRLPSSLQELLPITMTILQP